jgi:hypothetical protein
MRRRTLGSGWLLGLAVLTTPLAAQDSSAVRVAHITYLTPEAAYVDAGRLDGLREGARVTVLRAGASIATLTVSYLASHQASCRIDSTTASLAVGDLVRFIAVAPPADSTVLARAAAPAAPRRAPATALRGRAGVQYFLIQQRDGASGRLSQPALDLRLSGSPTGSPDVSVILDVRARRSYTVLADGTTLSDGRGRVYQAAIAVRPVGSPLGIVAGRQFASNLGSIGLFDGVLADWTRPGWSAGAFGGAQPEPINLGFSSSVVEGGGYVQRHSAPGTVTRWALTLGLSGSYQAAHANREFAFLQGTYFGPRLTALVTQEVDYYRWWKRLPGMAALSATNTFAFAQWRTSERLSLDAGFDSRRNVRLYRDVVNPVTTFDDTYRRGAWVGALWRVVTPVQVGMELRSSGGGPGGRSNSYTGSLDVTRLPGAVGVRARTTYYTTPELRGWLNAITLGADPGTRIHVGLNGGWRAEHDPLNDPTGSTVTWVGGDLDVTLARAWYLMLSATRQRGGLDGSDQLYAGVSFRF